VTTREPMSPLPPITMILMIASEPETEDALVWFAFRENVESLNRPRRMV
jgi:hypothetical protein